MSEAPTAPTPVTELSFEEALGELEAIVDRLDRGEIPLEQSIAAYERGTALRRHCEQKLAEARMRVERLVDDGSGGMTTEPLDADAP